MKKLIDYYKALVVDFCALNFWEWRFTAESATLDGQYLDPTHLYELEERHQDVLACIAHRELVKKGIGVFSAIPEKEMTIARLTPFLDSSKELYLDSDLKKIHEAGLTVYKKGQTAFEFSYADRVGMAWELWLIKNKNDHAQSGLLCQIREAITRLSQAPLEWFMPDGLDEFSKPIDIYGECDLNMDGLSGPVRKWLDRRVVTLIDRARSDIGANQSAHSQEVVYPSHKSLTGRCEDAPCCGCCD